MDIIFHHNACPDGFCAGFIAKRRYPEAELVGLDHGQTKIDVIEMSRGKDVLMVDFSLRTRAENVALKEAAKSFRIFDHHKTAQAELAGLNFTVFDMNRSGAMITWDELFGKNDDSVIFDRDERVIRVDSQNYYDGYALYQPPWYVQYVQDRDLWRHGLPHTKEVNAYIMTVPMTVEAWEGLVELSPRQAADLGTGALAQVNHYVREVVKHAQFGTIRMKDNTVRSIAIVNVPYLNVSEVGNVLATDHAEIGMGWFERGDGIIQFSLRSNGDIDVSDIAKLHGGGGHKNAAGFQLNRQEARNYIDFLLGRRDGI